MTNKDAQEALRKKQQEFNIALHAALDARANQDPGKDQTFYHAQLGQYGKDMAVLMDVDGKYCWVNPNDLPKGSEGRLSTASDPSDLVRWANSISTKGSYVIWEHKYKATWNMSEEEYPVIWSREKK